MIEAALRPATGADIPALHRLVESTYRGDSARAGWTHEADLLSGDRTSLDELAGVLASADHHILVAECEGDLLGTVTIQRIKGGRCYLGMLSVSPEAQSLGLGRKLIHAAEDAARRLFGAQVMEMTVIDRRAELIAYYCRCGYRSTGETRPFPYSPAEPVDFGMVVLERMI